MGKMKNPAIAGLAQVGTWFFTQIPTGRSLRNILKHGRSAAFDMQKTIGIGLPNAYQQFSR
jgi:hypothetical protein